MQNKARELLARYRAGTCTEEEKALVESWYLKLGSGGAAPGHELLNRTQAEVWQSLSANRAETRRISWPLAASAAVLLVAVAAALLLYQGKRTHTLAGRKPAVNKANDIAPGSNKAFLTLANGRKISLTDAARGEVAKEAGLSISKTADGQLVYTVLPGGANPNGARYNTIETPNGGQYQINLPDGSRVWLNSASSLHYPARFTGNKRVVELSGEGYFEVAKDKKHPFIVKTSQQQVEVLGTHFNINSYGNEQSVKTVLLEGAVKVFPVSAAGAQPAARILKPGEQSSLTGGELDIMPADTESAMAWKNGDFIFKGDDLESIMRQIARWYDVEVIYRGSFGHLKFGGYVSRSKNISAVLSIMESTGKVHFNIEGRRITVLR